MIVQCERCETQFRLDDASIPEDGVRVRCSRCKHAFLVPPASSAEAPADSVHEAVRQGLAQAETPEPPRDLIDETALGAEAEGGGDFDWEFENDDLPVFRTDADGSVDTGSGNVAEPDDAEAPDLELDGTSLATSDGPAVDEGGGLGNPSEWDLFDDDAPALAPTVAVEPARGRVRRSAPTHADPAAGEQKPSGVGSSVAAMGRAVGWAATLGLLALGLVSGLAPAPSATHSTQALSPDYTVEEVQGRWIDTLELGEVFVVTGRVRNTRTTGVAVPELNLVLRDANGDVVSAPLAMGSKRPEPALRVWNGDVPSQAASGRSWPLASGEAIPFEAVVWPLPEGTAHFEVRLAGRSG